MRQLSEGDIQALKSELKRLNAELLEVEDEIRSARELGDLSENAEYIEAKQYQANLFGRIESIEKLLHGVSN